MCSSRTYPYSLTEGHWKFLGGGGVLEAKFSEVKYEAKLELPGKGGEWCKTNNLGGARIFSGTTQYSVMSCKLKHYSIKE